MDRLSLSLDLSGEPVLTCHSRRRTALVHPRYRLTDLLRSAGQQPVRKATLLCITSFSGVGKMKGSAGNATSTLGRMRNGRPGTPAGKCRPLQASLQSTLGDLAVATAAHLKSRHSNFSNVAIRRAAKLRLVRGKCVGRSLPGLQDKVLQGKRHARARQSLGKEAENLPTEVGKSALLTGWEQDLREESLTPGRNYDDSFYVL